MPSGTHLDSWDGNLGYVLDATNALPLSGFPHIVNISGGSGIVAGRYYVLQSTVSFNTGQGITSVWRLQSGDEGTTGITDGARGCSWSFTIGRTDGDGTFGGNLISRPGGAAAGFCFDPDSPIPASMVGKTISISGGTGFTAGNYGIQNYFAGGVASSETQPDFVTIVSLTVPRTFPASAELANGAAWAFVSGVDLPTLTPNTGYTGAVNAGIAGDSISAGSTIAAELANAFPNASSVTVTNKAVTGARADDWARGQTYYNNAVTDFNLAGVTVVNVMLGTNPSASTAAWLAAMQSLVSGLFLDCPTVTKIVVQEIIYVVSGGGFDDTKVQAYNANRVNIGNGCVVGGSGAHEFFAADSCLLTDQAHPHPGAGQQSVCYLWLNNGLAEAIAPTVDTTPPTVAGTVTNSTTFTFAFSEAVTGFVLADYALSGGHTFSAAAGSGSSRTATITPPVTALETVTLSYMGTTTVDTATIPNAQATFSGAAVTNSSTLNVPGAPTLTVDEVEPAESGIMVSPEVPASNGGSAVLFYEIWHNIASAGFVLIGSIAAAHLVDGFLDRYVITGLSVDIKVRCRNAVGNSAYSTTRTVTSQGPDVLPTSGQTRLSLGIGIGL